jgi:hypothetical protein
MGQIQMMGKRGALCFTLKFTVNFGFRHFQTVKFHRFVENKRGYMSLVPQSAPGALCTGIFNYGKP